MTPDTPSLALPHRAALLLFSHDFHTYDLVLLLKNLYTSMSGAPQKCFPYSFALAKASLT